MRAQVGAEERSEVVPQVPSQEYGGGCDRCRERDGRDGWDGWILGVI
ncbi:hypothetical protein KKC06_06805 [Patescibacteria group bacterium]|nr:hypothetical protein [Patescibacteria group bacterium]